MIAGAMLTREQRESFERDGFIIVRGALDAAAVARFAAVTAQVAAAARAEQGLGQDAFIEVRNALGRDERLLDLVDWPATFPLVAELMGPKLQLSTTHVLVRPPQREPVAPGTKAQGWHRDGHADIPAVHGTCPWLYTKVGYFLSDCSHPGMGNLRVIPGSHLRAELPAVPDGAEDPEGALDVLVAPGDAVIFQQRLWHCVRPNRAQHARLNIYVGYCLRWVKPIDYLQYPAELLARLDPVRRQLLGDYPSACTYWLPRPGELPLADWLERRRAGAAAG